MKPLLSICIPCFKRLEYLRKTLDSIYEINSDVPLDEYEVIVSDNDPDEELSVLQQEYKQLNFKYKATICEGFMNSFYSLTYGTGEYLLLHNSQELFKKGALKYILDLLKCNKDKFIFFSSGFLLNGRNRFYKDFDFFMKDVSYWSSWSNAFGIWKKDFEQVENNTKLSKLFPQTSLFLTQSNHKGYLICDTPLFDTQFVAGRSGHNKFHAFSFEYPSLIDESCKNGNISRETRNRILHDILFGYLPLLYFNVKIARRESWSSDGFEKDIKRYYPKGGIWIVRILSLISPFRAILRKIRRNKLVASSAL